MNNLCPLVMNTLSEDRYPILFIHSLFCHSRTFIIHILFFLNTSSLLLYCIKSILNDTVTLKEQ